MPRPDGPSRSAHAHSVTEFARVDLASGSFDALSATHFSSRFPPHFHQTFAIGVVETGATRLQTPRGEWIGTAGTVLAFSPGEVHSAEPLTPDGYTYRMVYPSVEFMRALGVDESALSTGAPLFRTPVVRDQTIGRELHRAHIPLMEGAAGPLAENGIVSALRALVQRYSDRAAAASDPLPRHRNDREVIENAQLYMHQRFDQPLRIGSVAAACGLNAFHLIRVFRRTVGVPPYAYLVQIRVNRAQVMLSQGISPVDVAYSCGFSDQSHLTRTFKRVVGVPPGQYLRSIRAA